MAVINVQPIKLGKCKLNIKNGATDVGDFEKHVSRVQFDPSSSQVEWKGLDPDAVFVFPSAATWACALEYAQDWSSINSLSRYLFDNEGVELTAKFSPVSGGPSFTAKIVAVPGSIGGQVDTVATASVTLGCLGRPTYAAS